MSPSGNIELIIMASDVGGSQAMIFVTVFSLLPVISTMANARTSMNLKQQFFLEYADVAPI